MARTVLSQYLRLIYEKDGKKKMLSIRRFNGSATDENITTFKNAIEGMCDLTVSDVQITTTEDVQ